MPHHPPHHNWGPPPPPHHLGEIPIEIPENFITDTLNGDHHAARIIERALEYAPPEIRAGFYLTFHCLASLSKELADLKALLTNRKTNEN